MLNSPRTTAEELISGDYDFVITTYSFVFHQHRRSLGYKAFADLVRWKGRDAAEVGRHRSQNSAYTPTYIKT